MRGTVAAGYSLVELMFVAGLVATLSGVAVPPLLAALDDFRATGAARYLAARLQRARMEAVMRSAEVGVKFTRTAAGYAFAVYVDGNGNGIRSADIANAIDRRLSGPERLTDNFRDVDFGTVDGLPPVDAGSPAPGNDPIRLGASDMATFTAKGTASAGSIYIRSRRTQYVIRIFGTTGKTRLLKFDTRTHEWKRI
jgi:type II secretory pathway pseudopilin PulG